MFAVFRISSWYLSQRILHLKTEERTHSQSHAGFSSENLCGVFVSSRSRDIVFAELTTLNSCCVEINTMWSNGNKEEVEESLGWNIVSKKRGREKSRKMKTEKKDRMGLPTILETVSDNEVSGGYSSTSAEDDESRASSVSPTPSPLLLALIRPSSSYRNNSVPATTVGTQAKQDQLAVIKPTTERNYNFCKHEGNDINRSCSFAMKLNSIKDKVKPDLNHLYDDPKFNLQYQHSLYYVLY